MLDDLALFVAIVDAGSLSMAARQRNVPPATLTRRLQALEARLGCRLLTRSARRLQPTSEGWQYYDQCKPLLSSLHQVTCSLEASLHQVGGLLRVMAPLNMASSLLVPVWQRLLERYPEIRLDLVLSNELADMVAQGADLAIRVGDMPDSSLQQRRLGQVRVLLVASPAYLARRGVPKTPEDLADHDTLLTAPLRSWPLRSAQGQERVLRPDKPRLQVNEMQLAVRLAVAGHGIVLCPLSQCHLELADGRLQQVLPDWEAPPRSVYVVWPGLRVMPARGRALLDILLAFAAEEPLLQPGPLVSG